jgi:hypothetical protein
MMGLARIFFFDFGFCRFFVIDDRFFFFCSSRPMLKSYWGNGLCEWEQQMRPQPPPKNYLSRAASAISPIDSRPLLMLTTFICAPLIQYQSRPNRLQTPLNAPRRHDISTQPVPHLHLLVPGRLGVECICGRCQG